MTTLISVCSRCFKRPSPNGVHTCSPSGFDNPAQLLAAYQQLAHDHNKARMELAECHDAMNLFIFRVNIGQVKSVNTYAQFVEILKAHGIDYPVRSATSPEAAQGQPG